jgi:hypothetical protein
MSSLHLRWERNSFDCVLEEVVPTGTRSSCQSCPLSSRFTQLIRNLLESLSPLLESISHAREIFSSGRSSPDRPAAKHIILQAGIISELPHGERPVTEYALNKADDVFVPQTNPPE